MSEITTEATTEATAATGLTDDHAQVLLADAVKAAEAENTATSNGGTSLFDDPAAMKAEIERLRKENGAARTNAKAQAADEARNALTQEIGRALGLIKDEEPIDAATLTTELTKSQLEARDAALKLNVYRAAQKAQANPDALLDSVSFNQKLATVEPSDNDSISAAIAAAVEANPTLYGLAAASQTQVAPAMKPNPAQGASANPPMSVQERAAAAQAAGNTRDAIRLKASLALDDSI